MKCRFSESETELVKLTYPTEGVPGCLEKIKTKTRNQIQDKARHLGLRLTMEGRFKNHTYKVELSTFESVGTKFAAYVLGFIWGDGCVYERKHVGLIRASCLKEDMLEIYPIFKKTGDWRIRFSQREGKKEVGTIDTSNKPLARFLIAHDYGPHMKISAKRILARIPPTLRSYFYLGLFDADGCFYFNTNRKTRQASLTGPIDQNWDFFEELLSDLGITYRIEKTSNSHGKASRVCFGGRSNIFKFGTFIYQDADIGLQRKKRKYEQCIDGLIQENLQL